MVSGAIADLLKDLVGKVALHPVGKDGDHLGFWAKVGGYFHGCSEVQAGTGSNPGMLSKMHNGGLSLIHI